MSRPFRQPKRIKAMNATTHYMACSSLSLADLADFERLMPEHCWPEPVPPPVRRIWRWKRHDRKPFRQLGRNALRCITRTFDKAHFIALYQNWRLNRHIGIASTRLREPIKPSWVNIPGWDTYLTTRHAPIIL